MNNKTHRGALPTRSGMLLASIALLTIVSFGAQTAHALISTSLDFGDRGSEVTELQTYLTTDINLYPSGLITGYFGQLTRAGVERFQKQSGIVSSGTAATTGYGRVGPQTRAAINAKLGSGTSGADVYAPAILGVNVNSARDGASITWTASESALGKVYYSTSPIRISNLFDINGESTGEPIVSGTLASFDGIYRPTHTVNINNLTPSTTYYYLVVIFDSARNTSITLPSAFNTKQ